MAWLSGSEYLDSLVRDYLTFRGFNGTLKALDLDLKTDKDKGFRIDRIMQHILSFINSYDIDALKSYWIHLDSRFFCRFAKSHQSTVKRFEVYLYRLYLVHALQNSKQKEVHEFFDKMAQDLQNAAEWKEWFILPFIQSPDTNPTFSVYFNRQWAETFLVSLHNFLASLFSCMPEPDLVRACVDDGNQIQNLEKENEALKNQLKLFNSRENVFPAEDPDLPNDTDSSSTSSSLPKYVEANGIPGALMENIKTTESQPKRNPIFGFVTRQSGSTSPKSSSHITKQNSQGNDLGVSINSSSVSSSGKTIPKKSIKENKNPKLSAFEAQRRELMASTRKSIVPVKTTSQSSSNTNYSSSAVAKPSSTPPPNVDQNGNSSTQPYKVDQPSKIIPSQDGFKNMDNWTSEKPEDSPAGTPTRDQSSLLNGDLISYDNNIVLTRANTEKTSIPTSSAITTRSAVDEFVASYDFVNNLHKMSVAGQQAPSSGQNFNSSTTQSNQLLQSGSSPNTYKAYAEEPFLILSKDVFLEHHSGISQCRFDSTGTTIASIDKQGVVKVWQNEPRISTLATVMFHSPIQCLGWCNKPDDILLLGTANGSVRFFDTTTSLSREDVAVDDSYPWVTSIATHPAGTSFVCSCVRPSTESKKFLSASNHGILLIWKVHGNQVKLDHFLRRRGTSCEITCMEYNHNGNLLVAGDCQGSITLHDMKSYETLHTWNAHHGHVLCLQFSSDETLVFSFGNDGQFLAWSPNQLKKLPLKFNVTQKSSNTNPLTPNHDKGLRQGRLFALDPDGQHVLLCCENKGVVYKINITEQSLTQVLTLPEHKAPVTAVDWTSNKTCGHCLTGSSDGKVQVTTLLMQ